MITTNDFITDINNKALKNCLALCNKQRSLVLGLSLFLDLTQMIAGLATLAFVLGWAFGMPFGAYEIVIPICSGIFVPSTILGHVWINRYYKQHAEEINNTIIEISSQIGPDKCTLTDAVNKCAMIVRIRNLWRVRDTACPAELDNTLLTLVRKLTEYPEVQAYFLTHEAATDKVKKIAPNIFKRETAVYLDKMHMILYPEGSNDLNEYLSRVYKMYVASHEDEVQQLQYNMIELYKIKKARRDIELKHNFDEWMNGMALATLAE